LVHYSLPFYSLSIEGIDSRLVVLGRESRSNLAGSIDVVFVNAFSFSPLFRSPLGVDVPLFGMLVLDAPLFALKLLLALFGTLFGALLRKGGSGEIFEAP
jgi:hypothetical protein